jgi:hypothetical protein
MDSREKRLHPGTWALLSPTAMRIPPALGGHPAPQTHHKLAAVHFARRGDAEGDGRFRPRFRGTCHPVDIDVHAVRLQYIINCVLHAPNTVQMTFSNGAPS